MVPGPVGLVLDPARAGLGARSVAEVMTDFLAAEGIPHEVLDPRRADPSAYGTLLVSSGYGLRSRSNGPLRPPGPHVLNAVSIPEGAPVEHLRGYRYVAVRSSADLERLGGPRENVAVVPCVTTRFADRAVKPVRIPATVGVHFDPVSFAAAPDWHEHLRELKGLDKLYLPLDSCAGDRGVLSRLMHSVGEGRSVGERTPRELFEIVGGLRLLVCSSLHAAIFAYLQNVPFLVYAHHPPVEEYLRDRSLDQWTFRSGGEMLSKARRILDAAPDYREPVERDRETTERHFEILKEALVSSRTISVPEDLRRVKRVGPAYRFENETPAPGQSTSGSPSQAEATLQHFISLLEKERDTLHREIASQCSRIEELAYEIDRLHAEVRRREALIADMRRSRAWKLASWVQQIKVRLRSNFAQWTRKTVP